MSEERLLDDEYNPWTGEHLHRYDLAEAYLENNDTVLDLASGTGYGSYQLSRRVNGNVIGGDISASAIEGCSKKWTSQENLNFQVMDGTALPFADGFFNKVVSFETIEHTTKYHEMLNEFARVLKEDGIALISTPNILINSPGGVVINKFHTQEFTYEELREILGQHFKNVKLYGQQYIRYENKRTFRYKIAHLFERLFLTRGIRKLPLGLRDGIMKMLIGKRLYPEPSDYVLTEDIPEIKTCLTLFAVCKKK